MPTTLLRFGFGLTNTTFQNSALSTSTIPVSRNGHVNFNVPSRTTAPSVTQVVPVYVRPAVAMSSYAGAAGGAFARVTLDLAIEGRQPVPSGLRCLRDSGAISISTARPQVETGANQLQVRRALTRRLHDQQVTPVTPELAALGCSRTPDRAQAFPGRSV